jgi:hypothetical protein
MIRSTLLIDWISYIYRKKVLETRFLRPFAVLHFQYDQDHYGPDSRTYIGEDTAWPTHT